MRQRLHSISLIPVLAALMAVTGCGAKSPSSPDPAPLATQPLSYMMLASLPGNGDSGSVVATLDVPSSLLASSTGSVPKVLVRWPAQP